ncbi:MAG: hypothetical protein CMI75_08665 [Candidatus Pelagibacter sp.]|jgi:hypothetical protein|nr:hypothetical protein [Candidatus Pelagibacter sp.]|tara:strand:+ start:321 stop:1919 length:1599 start_codon:yes stop_codon:yes gene_type:complete
MIIFVADAFVDQYNGGAELTTEAIVSSCLLPNAKVLSQQVTVDFLKKNKNNFFVFGNFQNLSADCVLYSLKHLNYCVLEYDYKYCRYRSAGKHIEAEGSCDCHTTRRGKLISLFYNHANKMWWMSQNQKQSYKTMFSFLGGEVLSSVFSGQTLDYIESLDLSNKNEKWIISNSPSWIKGAQDAVQYAKENNLDYELVWGISHSEMLQKLASSKGMIFLPKAGDTCPRMVIEAKLLGCDLVLNENVQHHNESWFETRESCMEYLRSRTKVFWNKLENEFDYLPKHFSESDQRYIFVVPFYNAEDFLPKCINSIKRQRHENFKCFLIDDMSTDNSSGIVSHLIKDDSRFVFTQNKEKCYALKNIYNALESEDIQDEDVVILLDGDDWLSCSKILNALNHAYKDNCMVTYGSYVMHPYGVKGPEPSPYPSDVVENNLYRQDKWRASHLRTFKHHLWKKIDVEDLKDDEGKFYSVSYDQAIMLPLIEMASERVKYMDSVMHVYNKQNPLNVDKIKAQLQYETAQRIRQKSKYQRVG